MRKTDIHCHVLPGIDDGSQSWQESLEMLKLAAAQGFEAAVATPHASERFSDRTPREIREMCGLLEERAKADFGQTFRIYPGQEILYSEEAAGRGTGGAAGGGSHPSDELPEPGGPLV